MAWTFNTWSEITDTVGRKWKVVVAAGAIAIGGGTLYWWERDQPKYPAAQDFALLITAVNERIMTLEAYTGTNIPFSSGDYVASTLSGTNATEPNAITYYPAGPIYDWCKGKIEDIFETEEWIDMRPGVAWETNLSIFADNRVSWASMDSNLVDRAFWTNYLGWVEPYGSYAWTWHFPERGMYVSTSDVQRVARAVSLARARMFNDITPATPTNIYYPDTEFNSLMFRKRHQGDTKSTWAEALADAVDNFDAHGTVYLEGWIVGFPYVDEGVECTSECFVGGGGVLTWRATIRCAVWDIAFSWKFNMSTNFNSAKAHAVANVRKPGYYWMEADQADLDFHIIPAIPGGNATNVPLLWISTNISSDMIWKDPGDDGRMWATVRRPMPDYHDYIDGFTPTRVADSTNRTVYSGRGWAFSGSDTARKMAVVVDFDFGYLTNTASFW